MYMSIEPPGQCSLPNLLWNKLPRHSRRLFHGRYLVGGYPMGGYPMGGYPWDMITCRKAYLGNPHVGKPSQENNPMEIRQAPGLYNSTFKVLKNVTLLL